MRAADSSAELKLRGYERPIDVENVRNEVPFEVVAGGRLAEVSGSKRHGLLALLALRRGRVVSVDELIGK